MELNHYFKILWRRKIIIILTVVVTMIVVVMVTFMTRPSYEASTVLRIAMSTNGDLSYTDYTYSSRLMNTFIDIVTSRPMLTDLENRLNLTYVPFVSAEILPDTELIKITVEDGNPQIAAKAANTLAEILIEQSAPQYRGGKKSSQELLTDQLAQAKTDLDQAQYTYNTLLAKTLPDSQQLAAIKESLQSKQNFYTTLNDQYEKATLQGDTKLNAPLLKQQLENARTDLDQTQQAANVLEAKTLLNSQQIDAARQILQIKQNIYTTLSVQYPQTILRGETQANMMTVVETAVVPDKMSSPKILLNIALGLLIGLFAGLGLAFIFENLDTTLYNVEDVENVAQRTPIAYIPQSLKSELDISRDKATEFSESFRNLATSLQFISNSLPGKALLIMSAEQAQGKSTIVKNLAISLAELGEKVVIVDCDLRKPKIHLLFDLANETGLKDILEKEVLLKEALQETKIPGIKVLTSGSYSEHPSQLLGSIPMGKMVLDLKKQFDYVLFDSPAMLAVADVAIIARNVDGLIEVVRRTHARREAIQKTNKFLAGFPDKFIGLIINQAENNHNFNYYQHYRKSTLQPPLAENTVLTIKEE